MNRWYEVRQEVCRTAAGQTTYYSRQSVTHVASDGGVGGRAPRVVPANGHPRMVLPGRVPERSAPARPSSIPAGTPDVVNGAPVMEPARRRSDAGHGPLRIRPRGLVYEKEFPDPGCYVRVPFGPFEAELAPRLRAPQHLAPAHPIDCLVQVFRFYRPLPLDRLALVEGGDPEQVERFRLLTGEKARALGIPLMPQQRPAAQPGPEAAPPVAQPGQTWWTCSVLFDPTHGEYQPAT